LAEREREEGPSRTLNKGLTPFGEQAGFSHFAGLSLTPRHSTAETTLSPLGKAIAPRFRMREGPSSRLALLPHLSSGPGGRVIRAGSIGRDIVGKVKGFFIRRRGRGASSRLILGEINALWCQANRPASWALAKPYEKTGGWQGTNVGARNRRRAFSLEP